MLAGKPLLLASLIALISTSYAKYTRCEYQCGDGQCVSEWDRCDYIKDCENGADEKNCDYLHYCEPVLFMCKSGECLEAVSKCNGTSECCDESDERGCRAITVPLRLPTSADFERDYEHDMKHKSLPLERHAPQQTPKTKKFQCPERNASLYFSNDGTTIYRVNVSGAAYETPEMFLTSRRGIIRTLAADFGRNEFLYVTDRLRSQVRAVDQTNGEDRELVRNPFARIKCVAKDWLAGNVYFAEDGKLQRQTAQDSQPFAGTGIGVCMEEPRYLWDDTAVQCKLVIESAPTDQHKYRDLIVHPPRGLMMWIEDEPEGKLVIASMDGTKKRLLTAFGHVNAIAFDHEQERLYVAENGELDVMNLRTLERTSMKPIEPSAMIVFNCELFFIERTTDTLMKYVEDGPHEIILKLSGPRFSFSLAVVGENSSIGKQQNPCESLECREFCVLSEGVLEPVGQCQCADCQGPPSW